MKKILFILTSIVFSGRNCLHQLLVVRATKQISEKDSEQLLARMADPGSGMGWALNNSNAIVSVEAIAFVVLGYFLNIDFEIREMYVKNSQTENENRIELKF